MARRQHVVFVLGLSLSEFITGGDMASISRANVSGWLLGLFVVSGFAGLICQSIWSYCLGLTFGHAAYAQTLVLAIFTGGMALGAWLASGVGVADGDELHSGSLFSAGLGGKGRLR